MSTYIFTGPTLSVADARASFDAVYLPPLKQGDVYRVAMHHRPRAIGIIDGYFQHAPSVWHKEILWAMDRGIHVFGSASMGALRAAELSPFGMRGVGDIFEAYRAGAFAPYDEEAFEDDDEVAVVHGPAETGYVAVSEPLVNIRCTLSGAEREGVIGLATRDALVAVGKELYFANRSYETLLARADERGIDAVELDTLRGWLPLGKVNRKRQDALAMLAEMEAFLGADPEPQRVAYRFEHTEMWDAVTAPLPVSASAAPDDDGAVTGDAILEELRLELNGYHGAKRAALLRMLARMECDRRHLDTDRAEVRHAAGEFRRKSALYDRASVDAWLAENNLDFDGFDRLMADDARLRRLESLAEPELASYILDHLRLSGDYARLARRAADKRRALGSGDADAVAVAGADLLKLLAWYFEQRLGQGIPDDMEACTTGLGFADRDAFYRALRSEYIFVASGRAEKN